MKSIKRHLLSVVFAVALVAIGFLSTQVAHAGAMADYMENKGVDWLMRGQTFTPPATPFYALGTNACSDSGSPTEPSGNGYARISYAATLANWSGTQGTGTTVASTGSSGTTYNNAAITFASSTGAWAASANLVSVWQMDASSGGNVIWCITLTSPIAVTAAGFTLSFPANSLSFQIDN